MRKVYHGATQEITTPLVHVGRENLDFGKGFYVTDIRSQAKTWATVKARYLMDGLAYINEYHFDFDNAILHFRYKKFERYDGEWLHFIIDSRDGLKVWKEYDIIEGGVANDQVIDTVEDYENGRITAEQALGQLAYKKVNHQICIHTQEAIDNYLRYVESVELKGA